MRRNPYHLQVLQPRRETRLNRLDLIARGNADASRGSQTGHRTESMSPDVVPQLGKSSLKLSDGHDTALAGTCHTDRLRDRGHCGNQPGKRDIIDREYGDCGMVSLVCHVLTGRVHRRGAEYSAWPSRSRRCPDRAWMSRPFRESIYGNTVAHRVHSGRHQLRQISMKSPANTQRELPARAEVVSKNVEMGPCKA